MGAVKRVPADVICRVANVSVKRYKKIVWHTVDIVVRYSVPMDEYYDSIREIIDQCTDTDGVFVSAVFDFAFRTNIISLYSNVELPSDHMDLFEIVYSTDLYDVVCKNANVGQIKSIESAVLRGAMERL